MKVISRHVFLQVAILPHRFRIQFSCLLHVVQESCEPPGPGRKRDCALQLEAFGSKHQPRTQPAAPARSEQRGATEESSLECALREGRTAESQLTQDDAICEARLVDIALGQGDRVSLFGPAAITWMLFVERAEWPRRSRRQEVR